MAEEWFRNKWQRTGIFKSEELSSENIHFFITMLVIYQALMILKLRLKEKSQSKNEKYANGSVRARLMVRGGCLPVKE